MNSVKLWDTKLIYKNLLYHYTLIINYQEDKSRKQSFTITSKGVKYLEINISKEVKDPYTENPKTLI